MDLWNDKYYGISPQLLLVYTSRQRRIKGRGRWREEQETNVSYSYITHRDRKLHAIHLLPTFSFTPPLSDLLLV